MSNFTVEQQFYEACKEGYLERVKLIMNNSAFDVTWINQGLYSACFWGNTSIVKHLLPFMHDISIECFNCCYPMNGQENRKSDFLQIIQLILDHGGLEDFKVDGLSLLENTVSDNDFKQKALKLITEYLYRLDGPIYNENVLE
uniref:Ankyrin repeat protein n=1 Tax=viral metagenome TaxID=1070528 RepID=A0A6C0JRJ5_9ZZZZ